MPTIRPYNAEKDRPKRPNLAEEISVFHQSILRHSGGGVTITDSIPLREFSGSNPPPRSAPRMPNLPLDPLLETVTTGSSRAVQSRGDHGEHVKHPDGEGGCQHPPLLKSPRSQRHSR